MKLKRLKGVAHSFGHSFMSMMNYYDYYIEDIIASVLLDKQINRIEIDILYSLIQPTFIHDIEPVNNSVNIYCKRFFPQLLRSHDVDRELIKEARMSINYDIKHYNKERMNHVNYVCIVEIKAEGKTYSSKMVGYTVLDFGLITEIQHVYLKGKR
jgi:hypothetical protein